jgi:prepilin-type N-terminal cleavage/methylation domain-containing protein/prepilin-type processing-associated H-X9-DG protein
MMISGASKTSHGVVRIGFTMIELLVVIGIIVVLVSIVIPSLSLAKRASYNTTCSSNLRELGYDTQGFVNDTHGICFGHYSDYSTLWINQLRPYGNLDKTRFCPAATARTTNTLNSPSSPGNPGLGTATDGWRYDPNNLYPTYWNTPGDLPPPTPTNGAPVGSYLVNGYLYADGLWGPPWGRWPLRGPNANIPLFADGIWIDCAPNPGQTVSSTLDLNYGVNDGGFGRLSINRHGRAVNVVLGDGHVESVPLPKLWTLTWYPGWVPPTNLPVFQ